MSNICPVCGVKLTMLNTGIGGKLKTGEKLCIGCCKKAGRANDDFGLHSARFTLDEVKSFVDQPANQTVESTEVSTEKNKSNKKNGWIGLIVIAVLVFIGVRMCGGEPSLETKSERADLEVETNAETTKQITYEVVSEKESDIYSKAEVEIRLSDKIDESSIRRIAEKYKEKYVPKYRRAFIWFYVGDNKNCFATAHCEPDMKIEILQPQGIGVSAMAEKAKQVDGELIYCFYENDVTGCMYAIYTKGEQYFIKNVYPDGQTSIEEMIRKDLDDRIKFTYKTTGSYGDEYYEFYMGDLNLCNKEGKVFATARKYEK